MKQFKQLFTRLRRKPRREDKRGSTMALVMIITSALVIWVTCLAPLMSSTGIAALKVQNGYTDYLDSRSAIEYAKSELIYICSNGEPYTFAVIQVDPDYNDGEPYAVLPKITKQTEDSQGFVSGSSPQPENKDLPIPDRFGGYGYYVSYDTTEIKDSSNDSPDLDKGGHQVVAICTVTAAESSDSKYNIVITSYVNGEKSLVLKVPYTHIGTLWINPESYRKFQALPLNDYVLVNGNLGGSIMWTHEEIYGKIGTNKYGFPIYGYIPYEILKPYDIDPKDDYATSLKYPALFKGTAEAAEDDGKTFGTPEEAVKVTPKNWIMPEIMQESNTTASAGSIKVTINNNNSTNATVSVQYHNGTQWVSDSSKFTVYYNGSTTLPTVTGYGKYTITVDFAGTGTYKEDGVNIMPRTGMVYGTTLVYGDFPAPKSQSINKLNISVDSTSYDSKNNTVKVDLQAQKDNTNLANVLYGYYTVDTDGKDVFVWNEKLDENSFILEIGHTYHFYSYQPARVEGSTMYNASSVHYGGALHLYAATQNPESGKTYYLLNNSGKAMNTKFGSTDFGSLLGNNSVFYSTKDLLDNDYRWTLTCSDSGKWSITGNGSKLGINQTDNKDNTYTYKLLLGGNYKDWTLASGSISQIISEDEYQQKEGDCNSLFGSWEKTGKKRNSAPMYVQFGSTSLSTNNNSPFYFVEVPSDTPPAPPNVKVPDYPTTFYSLSSALGSFNYGATVSDVMGRINSQLPDGVTVKQITTISGANMSGKLNPGTYLLKGSASDNKEITSFEFAVQQGEWKSDSHQAIINKGNNDLQMVISLDPKSNSWHNTDDNAIHYFGYQIVTKDNKGNTTYSQTYWDYSIGGDSLAVNIDYATYVAIVAESDTWEYALTCTSPKSPEYNPPAFEINEDWGPGDFVFDITNDNKLVWYALPDGVTVNMLEDQILYSADLVNWGTAPTTPCYYGVRFKGGEVMQVRRLAVTRENDHVSSMMRGKSLYFMGETASINTYGNTIYLDADLIVLKNKVISSGKKSGIIVNNYTKPDSGKGRGVLLFTKEEMTLGTVTLKENTFYLIDPNTDLLQLSLRTEANPNGNFIEYGCIDYAKLEVTDGTTTTTSMSNVQTLVDDHDYPNPNLDIIFANADQLSAIKNAEELNWTNGGNLERGGNSGSNSDSVVCVYLDGTIDNSNSNPISYSANRILIATAEDKLSVNGSVNFTTRYLSIDAGQIKDYSGSSKFTITSLPKTNHPFKMLITSFFDSNAYQVKGQTLQIDYEQKTTILASNDAPIRPEISRQVYRYNSGTNLFDKSNYEAELLVTYELSEINSWFTSGSGLMRYVALVDRYVKIADSDNTNGGRLSTDGFWGSRLDIYANYIYIDESVRYIQTSTSERGELRIHTQESGYTDDEYVFSFKAADEYSGTLIYIAPGTASYTLNGEQLSVDGIVVNGKPIATGFYYIFSNEPGSSIVEKLKIENSGTNIALLAKATDTTITLEQALNNRQQPFKIDPQTLKNYSVYIMRDGSLSNSAVDTEQTTGSLGLGMSGSFGEAKVE